MKRNISIILVFLLTLTSLSFIYSYLNYIIISHTNIELKENLKTNDRTLKEANNKHHKLQETNSTLKQKYPNTIGEYQKWQKRLQKIETKIS